MTTRATKPVTREVPSARYGALIVTVSAAGVMYRQKGRRTVYGPIQHERLFEIGAKMHADADLADKQKNRKRSVKRGLLSVGV